LWSQNKKKKNKNVPAVALPPLKGYPFLPPPTELEKEIKRYEDMSDTEYNREYDAAASSDSDHPLPQSKQYYVRLLTVYNLHTQQKKWNDNVNTIKKEDEANWVTSVYTMMLYNTLTPLDWFDLLRSTGSTTFFVYNEKKPVQTATLDQLHPKKDLNSLHINAFDFMKNNETASEHILSTFLQSTHNEKWELLTTGA